MIFGYSTNAFVKFTLSESIEKIAKLGFQGVEIMGDRPHLYPPDFDDAAWKTIDAGATWESQGFARLDGVAWYRRSVDVPSAWASRRIYLAVGDVDDGSDLYINMVAAGEASGALELVLLRLAEYTENQVRIRNRIQGAMIYPAVMTLVSFGVLGLLLTFVVPKFVAIFAELQQTLPLPTVILIGTSSFFRSYWYLVLGATGGLVYLASRYRRTPPGRRLFDRMTLRIPVFGRLVLLGVVIRFARTLSTLLSSGVPLLKALEILSKVVNHTVFEEAIAAARDSVIEGASLSQPLKQSGIFPPIVIHMIASGEQSGQLEEMLSKVADIYEEEADTLTSTLTSLLEPALILGMAVLVAFIVISILLPLLEMNQIVAN